MSQLAPIDQLQAMFEREPFTARELEIAQLSTKMFAQGLGSALSPPRWSLWTAWH